MTNANMGKYKKVSAITATKYKGLYIYISKNNLSHCVKINMKNPTCKRNYSHLLRKFSHSLSNKYIDFHLKILCLTSITNKTINNKQHTDI